MQNICNYVSEINVQLVKYRRFGAVVWISCHPKARVFDELGMRLTNQLSSQQELCEITI